VTFAQLIAPVSGHANVEEAVKCSYVRYADTRSPAMDTDRAATSSHRGGCMLTGSSLGQLGAGRSDPGRGADVPRLVAGGWHRAAVNRFADPSTACAIWLDGFFSSAATCAWDSPCSNCGL